MPEQQQTQKEEVLSQQAEQTETTTDTSNKIENEVVPDVQEEDPDELVSPKAAEETNTTTNLLAQAGGEAPTFINGNPFVEATKGG